MLRDTGTAGDVSFAVSRGSFGRRPGQREIQKQEKGKYMYQLNTHASFDSAHFLAGYEGKCRNLHGHRWKLSVTIQKETVEDQGQTRGMVVDFGELKDKVKMIADEFDHALIIEKDTLKMKTMEALREEEFRIIEVEFRPTAENFAKYFYDRIKQDGCDVSYVEVYETPNNRAIYGE